MTAVWLQIGLPTNLIVCNAGSTIGLRILSVELDPCIEAQAISALNWVTSVPASETRLAEFDPSASLSAIRALSSHFPGEPPGLIYCFSSDPFVAYRLLCMCTATFGVQIPLTHFTVRPGSIYPGLGTVVSYFRLSGRGAEKEIMGRAAEGRAENAFIASFILLKSAYQPVNLSILEEFVERMVRVREARGRARLIWKYCVGSGLAVEEPLFLVGARNRMIRSATLKPTEAGLAWSVKNSYVATGRVDPEEAESVFSDLEKIRSQATNEENLLLDMCPIISGNDEVFSLYTMNFAPSRNVIQPNVPGPCPFVDLRIPKERAEEVVARYVNSKMNNDRPSKSFFELLRAKQVGGKLYIFCCSQRDEQVPFPASPAMILERIQKQVFDFEGKCPFRYEEICMVQSPRELLLQIRQKVPSRLGGLKFQKWNTP